MNTPKQMTQTPDSDIPPADWREDGFFEDWDDGDDDDGYDESEGW